MTPTYHSIAYAGFEVANPVALDAILALLGRTGLPEGAVALDIGAGAGGVSVALAREFGLRVQAIERYPDMAEMIRDRAEAAGVADRVAVVAEGSATVLDRLAPADLIVALGSTEPAGPGIRSATDIFARLSDRLASSGWLLWGDLTWKGEPPEPLRQVIGATGDYATHEGWLAAAEAAGLEVVSAEIAPRRRLGRLLRRRRHAGPRLARRQSRGPGRAVDPPARRPLQDHLRLRQALAQLWSLPVSKALRPPPTLSCASFLSSFRA